jgi:hypothetical protein
MKKLNLYFTAAILMLAATMVTISCKKETAPTVSTIAPPVFPPAVNPSFTEDFNDVSNLTSRGWVFVNNSSPIGNSGWRQGRYESATGVQYKFLNPVAFIGFQAYNSTNTPNDFISCDATCVNDIGVGKINISAWLISPQVALKNGDELSFYTRAVDDANYSVYTKDRMQVRANIIDGSANCSGGSDTANVGNFTLRLLDINQAYKNNDPAGNTPAVPGYPQAWKKYTITVAGIPGTGSVAKARFAFRYVGLDAGIAGAVSGNNYPSVVGVDNVVFKSN